jgi:hypothetical protein
MIIGLSFVYLFFGVFTSFLSVNSLDRKYIDKHVIMTPRHFACAILIIILIWPIIWISVFCNNLLFPVIKKLITNKWDS